MRPMKPDPGIRVQAVCIPTENGGMSALLLSPLAAPKNAAGILWLHGGGYIAGMKEMVHASRAVDLVKKFGAVVLSPGYRLALKAPYPAAIDDCYAALLYLKAHAAAFGVRSDQLMVGGESAGGGLGAAVCIRARDEGKVSVAFQMPLYPMLDDRDTESSRDNRGRVWNTRRNHFAWRLYLRGTDRAQLSPYAAPARLTDFSHLPPAYSFVGDGEPFYAEAVRYFERLRAAGVPAELDVYHSDMHAFDMMRPDDVLSIQAAEAFNTRFADAQARFLLRSMRFRRNAMIREICKAEVFLAQKAEAATADDLNTAQDLLDTLIAHKDGCVGMAANMIGVNKRIIAFENDGEYMLMFNPVIVKKSGPYDTEEGCLSLTGTRKAKRFQTVKVQWQNEKFQTRLKTFTGWTAEIIQHEIDHCEGIVI